jgi:outer membrane protein TolC
MRSRGVPLIAVLLAVGASGCAAVGPDFTPPAAPSTARYTSPGEAPRPKVDAGPAAPKQTVMLGERVTAEWWTLFRSPDLDQLVKQAIAGSHTLESANARLAQARETVTAASSAASYALDIFGGTRRRIEQQSALADFQFHQLDAAYLTLTGNTVTQAIQVAAIRARLKAVSATLDIDRQNLELVRRERQVGSVPDRDVVIAESQLAVDETLQPGLDQQLSAARHALAVLLGRAPGDWSPPDFDLAALTPSELVHQRPDIQAAETQLHAARAQIGIATAQLYPAITLSAGLSVTALDLGQLFNPAGLVWNIAAGFAQPVFDGRMRQAERRAALAAFKAAAADYQQTVLLAFGQVADLLQALTHDARLLAAQQRALDTAAESVRLQRHRGRQRHSRAAGFAAPVPAGPAWLCPGGSSTLPGHDTAPGRDGRRPAERMNLAMPPISRLEPPRKIPFVSDSSFTRPPLTNASRPPGALPHGAPGPTFNACRVGAGNLRAAAARTRADSRRDAGRAPVRTM